MGAAIKILFKDAISLLLFPFTKVINRCRNSQGVRVLVYHCVADSCKERFLEDMHISKRLFNIQISHLSKANYNVISLGELYDYLMRKKEVNPRKTICLTFDDGFDNDYSILKGFGFAATIFPVYSSVGKERRFLSWEQLAGLGNNGFSIGSHSLNHKRPANLGIAELKKEVIDSKELFETKLSMPVEFFAYPFGWIDSFNQTTRDIVREAGFKAAFINIMGTNSRGDDLFTLKRTRISQNDNLWKFRLKLAGAYDWIDFLKIYIERAKLYLKL